MLSSRPPFLTRVRKNLKQILTEYGVVALVVHYVIFFVVLFSFWTAIRMGWRTETTAASAGTFGAAYLATKVTQPIRIAVTLVITPLVARIYERVYERVTGRPVRRPEPEVVAEGD